MGVELSPVPFENHIHNCRGDQGDGIEVKQGSWGNLIAEKPVNVIERNLCRRSTDSTMQVQGEAIVRNNVLIGASGSGFASTDHQGQTLNLQGSITRSSTPATPSRAVHGMHARA